MITMHDVTPGTCVCSKQRLKRPRYSADSSGLCGGQRDLQLPMDTCISSNCSVTLVFLRPVNSGIFQLNLNKRLLNFMLYYLSFETII